MPRTGKAECTRCVNAPASFTPPSSKGAFVLYTPPQRLPTSSSWLSVAASEFTGLQLSVIYERERWSRHSGKNKSSLPRGPASATASASAPGFGQWRGTGLLGGGCSVQGVYNRAGEVFLV